MANRAYNPNIVTEKFLIFSQFINVFNLTFTAGKTQDELLALWLQEAKVAMGGKKKGKVVDIWKALGERKVKISTNFLK